MTTKKTKEKMTETQFLIALSKTTRAYDWTTEGKSIKGKAKNGKSRGSMFSPVTAVARYLGLGTYTNARTAACKLGLTKTFTNTLSKATKANSNRGETQVLRGRVKQALGVTS